MADVFFELGWPGDNGGFTGSVLGFAVGSIPDFVRVASFHLFQATHQSRTRLRFLVGGVQRQGKAQSKNSDKAAKGTGGYAHDGLLLVDPCVAELLRSICISSGGKVS
jgi:hypothetical protein